MPDAMTYVFNLKTGEEWWYSLAPADAVVAAYYQGQGNFNTWTYDKTKVPVQYGKRTVSAGDWCAVLTQWPCP